MRDTFGARLRQHRERRGLSLAEIAHQTKIKATLFEGLERDDISAWPSGIFRRAYVRAYAGAIGFDVDAAVREFLELHPEPVEVLDPPPPPPTGLRGLMHSAFGSFRRRGPDPAEPPALPQQPVAADEVASATVGKLPAEPAASARIDLAVGMPPAAAPQIVARGAQGSARSPQNGGRDGRKSLRAPHLVSRSVPIVVRDPEIKSAPVTQPAAAPEPADVQAKVTISPAAEAPAATEAKRPIETPLAAEPRAGLQQDPPAATAQLPRAAKPETPAARPAPDFIAAAKVCTDLGRVREMAEVPPLLRDAAKILGARGLIVWVWDSVAEELRPVLVHGYSSKIRARLRGVSGDADNVTAAAFRASAPLAVSGALAVPLLTSSGCAGVLAIEVPAGAEQDGQLCAAVTLFAAMLAQLVGVTASSDLQDDRPAAVDLSAGSSSTV